MEVNTQRERNLIHSLFNYANKIQEVVKNYFIIFQKKITPRKTQNKKKIPTMGVKKCIITYKVDEILIAKLTFTSLTRVLILDLPFGMTFAFSNSTSQGEAGP